MRLEQLHDVKKQYRSLVVEIENLPGGNDRDNLLHTVYKLGNYLHSALGVLWGAAEIDLEAELRKEPPK